MKIFLDTEFNGFKGDLISIGMVAEDGQIFYAVRNATQSMDIDPWVNENVFPFLDKHPLDHVVVWEGDDTIQSRMQFYFLQYKEVEIIVDWPEDIQHICKIMITGAGTMINTPNTMRFTIDRMINGISEVPHNALYDAIANLRHYISMDDERDYNGI
jgi:hypothetical protein